MATSVVPSVRKKLRDRLRARPNLSRVQVSLGKPWPPENEFIAIRDVRPHDQRQAGMRTAPHPREEEFTLHVLVSVIQGGHADSEAVVDRAYALAAELEQEIRDDMTIGGALTNGWAQVEGLELEDIGPNDDGIREARVHARVACRARI